MLDMSISKLVKWVWLVLEVGVAGAAVLLELVRESISSLLAPSNSSIMASRRALEGHNSKSTKGDLKST